MPNAYFKFYVRGKLIKGLRQNDQNSVEFQSSTQPSLNVITYMYKA